jgi:outer membrane receptor protein involved in Fe transport
MKQRLFYIIWLISASLLVPPSNSAKAEESSTSGAAFDYLLTLSIDELAQVPIQSSGLFAMAREKAPGTYYIVTSDQLENFGIRSLTEYLNRMAPSFATVTHGTQGTTVGSRGILIDNSSKTLLLRDNLNMNNRFFVGINGSDLASPLLGDIERVEISPGPSTLLHGSGAINGYINMISATGATKPGLRINSSYGSGDFRLLEGSFGKEFNKKANLFLYAGYDKSDGVRPKYTFPADQWSSLNEVTGTPSATFLDNVRVGKTDNDYKFSLRGQLGAEGDFFRLDLKALLSHTSNVDPALGYYLSSSASWAEEVRLAADNRNGRYSPFYEQHSDIFLLSPEMTLHANKDNEIKFTPYYETIKTTSVFSDFLLKEVERLGVTLQAKPNGTLDDCPSLNCAAEYTYGDEVHIGASIIDTYSGINNQTIAWGGEVKYFDFKSRPWSWNTLGLFAEDQIEVGKFTILPGLRYDKTYFKDTIATVPTFTDGPYKAPDDVDHLSKRLAIAYQLAEDQTVKLSYQEGFRFADSWPQIWQAHLNVTNGTNIQLSPEESIHYEADYTANGLIKDKLDISTALFYNVYKYTQSWFVDSFNFGNSAKDITSIGGEITAEFRPFNGCNVGISYSYARPLDSFEQDARIANDDETWTRYPSHMFKMHGGCKITPRFFVGSLATLESPRYEKSTVTDPRVEELFDNWSFIMDVNSWYQLNQKTKISFTAKELLHINYNQAPAYYSGTRPLDSPRPANPQFYISISYAF